MTLAPSRTIGTPGIDRFTPAQLLRTARLFASDPALPTLLDLTSGHRQWAELDSSASLQVWLIGWPAGTDTGWHDHGDAAGAFVAGQGAPPGQTPVGGGPPGGRPAARARRALWGPH